MLEKIRCEICDRTFKDAEGLAMHNKAKHPEKISRSKKEFKMPISKGWAIFLFIILVVIGFIWWGVSSRTVLPPTDMQGHIESNPPSHVLKEPMPLVVQKHMLEHVDGIEGGRGGVIINYNCKDYDCEDGLIENLESFTSEFEHVYVAPFKGMDAKIAITKLGKIDVLEEYDENRIRNFIERR